MDTATKKAVIATLIKAGKPHLANLIANPMEVKADVNSGKQLIGKALWALSDLEAKLIKKGKGNPDISAILSELKRIDSQLNKGLKEISAHRHPVLSKFIPLIPVTAATSFVYDKGRNRIQVLEGGQHAQWISKSMLAGLAGVAKKIGISPSSPNLEIIG